MSENIELASDAKTVRSRLLFFAFVLLTFATFIGLDVLTPLCFDDAWPGLFLMILLVGQLTLICVWGTLVEGTFWFRLPWTILLLVISWSALCFGVYLKQGYISSAEILGMGLVWLYGFAISYVPLKVAAWLFGWRIRLVSENQIERSSNYAIRDIMLGTAILAVTLSIGRYLMPTEWPSWTDVIRAAGFRRPDMLFAFCLFSIISLIVKLPCIWVSLAADRSKIIWLSVVWVLCSGALGLLEMILLVAILGNPGSETSEVTACLVLGHATMAASMIAVLFGLRCFGYRMSRKASQRAATQKS